MNSKDVNLYIERYNQRLDKFGYSPESLGWGGGKERQFVRFKALTEIGVEKHDSLLDVGCGFADLYEYLKLNEFNGQYLGVDINGNLLDLARKEHQGVNVEKINILEEDINRQFNWVVSSGIFNLKLNFEDNLTYIKTMLKKMYEISNKGVAVDFMSTYV